MDKDQLLTLSRPNKLCMNCNAAIDEPGRHASIVRSSEKLLERFDYCPACWDHIKNEAFESFWMARREKRVRRAPRLNRRQRSAALRALFESLRERCDDEDLGARLFLISHLLMKWGGFKWRENLTAIDGSQTIVFEDAASGERFEIPSADIAEEKLLRIKGEIDDFLMQFSPDPLPGEGAESLTDL